MITVTPTLKLTKANIRALVSVVEGSLQGHKSFGTLPFTVEEYDHLLNSIKSGYLTNSNVEMLRTIAAGPYTQPDFFDIRSGFSAREIGEYCHAMVKIKMNINIRVQI